MCVLRRLGIHNCSPPDPDHTDKLGEPKALPCPRTSSSLFLLSSERTVIHPSSPLKPGSVASHAPAEQEHGSLGSHPQVQTEYWGVGHTSSSGCNSCSCTPRSLGAWQTL